MQQITKEKLVADIRDQAPTGLEVLDPPFRQGDDTGKNYAEAIVTGFVEDPEEIDGRTKIIVGYVEAAECRVTEGKSPQPKSAMWISGIFMYREVFADFVMQDGEDAQERTEQVHSEAVERIMSHLYDRLFQKSK